jgi:hypothetical protein
MSVCFVVVPVIVVPAVATAWPVISAAVIAAGASMGYRAVTRAERGLENQNKSMAFQNDVQMTMLESEVVAAAFSRGESFSLERDGIIATFRIDGRGACQVHLSGENKSNAELEKAGIALMDRVRQQYAYAKVMQEMETRGFQVTSQEVEENNSIRIRVRRQ